MKEFKLKEEEIKLLKTWGNTDEDIEQIEESVNYAIFTSNKDNIVDWVTAKRMIGTNNFLSGISRAAFHWTCSRANDKRKSITISFDFSNYFK